MADSTADFTRKILVDVELKSEQIKKDVPVLTQAIQDLTDAQKVLEVQGKKNTQEFTNNATQIRQLKAEVRDANKYIDNTAKAINAESNSIAQNRALLSLLTAEHIKLGQANGNTKAQVDASAKAINSLTDTLKAQEKQIGQTYRNVGNYTDSIKEALSGLESAIPGFQQFNSAIQVATKIGGFLPSALANVGTSMKSIGQQATSFVGFKTFGTQAEDAKKSNDSLATSVENTAKAIGEAGEAAKGATAPIDGLKDAEQGVASAASEVAGSSGEAASGFGILEGAGIALSGALAIVVVGIAAVISYFKDLDTFTDGAAQNIGALKASWSEFGRIVAGGGTQGDDKKSFVLLDRIKSIKDVFTQTKDLIDKSQLLEDSQLNQSVKSAKAQAEVAKLQVEARNRTLDPGQAQKLLDQATAIDEADLKSKEGLVEAEIKLAQKSIEISGHLTDYQKDQLQKRGVEYALYLQNNLVKQGKVTDAQTKGLAESLNKQTQIQQEFTQRDEKRQNLSDRRDSEDERKKEAADAKAQAAAEKAERLRQAQLAAYAEAEQIRKSSANKILQSIYEEYGDRAVAADQSYNAEILKLQKFRAKKLITEQEYNSVEAQLQRQHVADVAKIIDDFQKSDYDKYVKASNELKNMQIANIKEDNNRNIQSLTERGIEQAQALDDQNQQHLDNIKALNIEIANLSDDEQAEARARLVAETNLIDINDKKKIEIAKSTAAAIDAVNKKALDDQNRLKDENDVTAAVKTNGANSSEALAARQKQLLDNYNAEVSNENLTAAAKLEIERKYLADKAALDQADRQVKIDQAVQLEQTIQSGVVDIISQNQQQNSAKRLRDLDQAKNQELANTALTNTQKQLINNKYTALENQEKLKAFKANQKLQVANALINGAVAITKTIAEMGFLPAIPFVALTAATTAFSVAKILGQKPAFATGGVFESDGRGAVLPGYSKTDNTNAKLRSGEGIVVSEAMRAPWARNIVSDINVAFGGRSFSSPGHQKAFATGGIFTDGGNANRFYSQPVVDAGTLANTLAYQLINNFPPVVADIKDIINQQSILINTQNRVIL